MGGALFFWLTSEKCPDADLKEVRSRRAEELLDVVETLALRLWDEEETEEEGEDGDASKHPEGSSLGQSIYLEVITMFTMFTMFTTRVVMLLSIFKNHHA